MTYEEELKTKYSEEIEILNNLQKGLAYNLSEIGVSEYAARSIYANGFVQGLSLEQIGGTIYTITVY